MGSPKLSRYFHESDEQRAARRDLPKVDLSIDTDPLEDKIGPFRLSHRTLAEAWRWRFTKEARRNGHIQH